MTALLRQLEASALVGRAANWPRRTWLLAAAAFAAFCWLCWFGGMRHQFHPKLLLLPILPGCTFALLVAAAIVRGPRRVSRHFLAGLTLFALLAGFDARRCSYRPEGDEPWYVAMADSLAFDGDLDIPPAELQERSPWYFYTPLPPEQLYLIHDHYRVSHWPALSVLLAPASRLHDVFLGRLVVALLAALGAGLGSAVLSLLWGSEWLGLASIAFLVFETPYANYALMLFTDGLAAALFLIALALLADGSSRLRTVTGGVVAGTLVWFKLPFLLITGACALLALFVRLGEGRSLRGAMQATAACILVLVPFVGFQASYFGATGTVKSFASSQAPDQLAASLFEPGRGLLVHYPACAFLLAAVLWVGARRLSTLRTSGLRGLATLGASALAAGLIALPVLIPGVLATGGWAPPGRYWIPVLAVFVVVVAAEHELILPVWRRLQRFRAFRFVFIVTLAVGVMTNVVLTLIPHVAFTDGPHWIQRFH